MIDYSELEEIVSILHSIQNSLNKLDIQQYDHHLNELDKRFDNFEKNYVQLQSMIQELKSCVSMSRACLQESKVKTPHWYKLSDTPPPPQGDIWVKDINGHEMLAKCEGRCILYPANSEMKCPEFWKPI